MSFKRRIERLEGRADAHHSAADAAVRLLTDEELEHLDNALKRGFDPEKKRQSVLVSPAEWAAYETFRRHYEELA